MRRLIQVGAWCLRGLGKLLGYALGGVALITMCLWARSYWVADRIEHGVCSFALDGRKMDMHEALFEDLARSIDEDYDDNYRSSNGSCWCVEFSILSERGGIGVHSRSISLTFPQDGFQDWMEDIGEPTGEPVRYQTRPAGQYPQPLGWSPKPRRFLGFAGGFGSSGYPDCDIVVPYWAVLFLVVLLATPLLFLEWRARRQRRRGELGLCLRCGYDLRASENRCPECGMTFGVVERKKPGRMQRWLPWWVRGPICVVLAACVMVGAGKWWLGQYNRAQIESRDRWNRARDQARTIVDLKQITAADLERLRGMRELRRLRLGDSSITDSQLAVLSAVPNLRELELYGTHISDSGLAHVASLTELRRLSLGGTAVSDAGLVHLWGLAKLKDLGLNGNITDGGLARIARLTDLEFLWLEGATITDAGLVHLKGMGSLNRLVLSKTAVTDRGLEHLKGTASLGWLELAETGITDGGLEHVKGMPNLCFLDLSGTAVTNAGLERLKGLQKLTSLRVARTRVTAEGIQKLKVVMPELQVEGP